MKTRTLLKSTATAAGSTKSYALGQPSNSIVKKRHMAAQTNQPPTAMSTLPNQFFREVCLSFSIALHAFFRDIASVYSMKCTLLLQKSIRLPSPQSPMFFLADFSKPEQQALNVQILH